MLELYVKSCPIWEEFFPVLDKIEWNWKVNSISETEAKLLSSLEDPVMVPNCLSTTALNTLPFQVGLGFVSQGRIAAGACQSESEASTTMKL